MGIGTRLLQIHPGEPQAGLIGERAWGWRGSTASEPFTTSDRFTWIECELRFTARTGFGLDTVPALNGDGCKAASKARYDLLFPEAGEKQALDLKELKMVGKRY
jgi:hypothetical protein